MKNSNVLNLKDKYQSATDCSKPRGRGSGAKPFYLRTDNTWHSYFSLCHLCVLCGPVWEGPSCAAKGAGAALMTVIESSGKSFQDPQVQPLNGLTVVTVISKAACTWFCRGQARTQERACRGGGNSSILVCLNWLLRYSRWREWLWSWKWRTWCLMFGSIY